MSGIPTSMQGLHDAIFGNVNNDLQSKDYINLILDNVINVFGFEYIYEFYYGITNRLKPILDVVTEGDDRDAAFTKVENEITNIPYDTLESYKTQLRGYRQILNALVSCQSTIDSTFLNTIVSIYNGVNDNDHGSVYIGKMIKNAIDKLPTTTYNSTLFAIKMNLDEFHRLIASPQPRTRANNINGFMLAIPLYINATSTDNINNIKIFLVGCRQIMAKVIACNPQPPDETTIPAIPARPDETTIPAIPAIPAIPTIPARPAQEAYDAAQAKTAAVNQAVAIQGIVDAAAAKAAADTVAAKQAAAAQVAGGARKTKSRKTKSRKVKSRKVKGRKTKSRKAKARKTRR